MVMPGGGDGVNLLKTPDSEVKEGKLRAAAKQIVPWLNQENQELKEALKLEELLGQREQKLRVVRKVLLVRSGVK